MWGVIVECVKTACFVVFVVVLLISYFGLMFVVIGGP